MRFSSQIVVATAAFAGMARAKEMPVDEKLAAEVFDSGLRHETIMMMKEQLWSQMKLAGEFESSQFTSFDKKKDYVECKDGVASYVPGNPKYTFKCKDLDLYDFKTHAELGSGKGRGAGSWGWTSPRGREFIAIAQEDGTSFSEVSDKGKLIYLGRLPQYTTAQPSLWREIKGFKSFIVIGSEAENHGIQIFDMRKLEKVDAAKPVNFTNEKDLTGWWSEGLPLGRSHNVVTNEEKNYAVATGFQPRNATHGAGLFFIDLTDPSKPTSIAGTGMDGYVHDAQCIVYRGPDLKYWGRDICYGYDEDTLTIFDVSNKKNIKIISRTSYEGVAFTHQGWVLDPNWQHYLIMDDEYDEVNITEAGGLAYPKSYIWDVSSLEKPRQTGSYTGSRSGIDHNQFVVDGLSYQSNYALGLTILDIRSVYLDPTGKGIKEVAYFDTYPEDDNSPGGGEVKFTGSWSHYPYFKSGYIVINTMDRGAFVVKRSRNAPWWWPFSKSR